MSCTIRTRLPARILVVNTLGQVWAHDLTTKSSGISFGPPNTVGAGYKLNGSSLFGAPNDKYVLCDTLGRLLVVNTLGQVWAHDLSNSSAIGGGVELSGPALFGTDSNDKYVVVYNVEPPSAPSKVSKWPDTVKNARRISASSSFPFLLLPSPRGALERLVRHICWLSNSPTSFNNSFPCSVT